MKIPLSAIAIFSLGALPFVVNAVAPAPVASEAAPINVHARECWTKNTADVGQHVRVIITTDDGGVVRAAVVTGDDINRMSDPKFSDFTVRADYALLNQQCVGLPLPPDTVGQVNVLTFRFSADAIPVWARDKPQPPYMGWITRDLPTEMCPTLESENRIFDIFHQEMLDMAHYQKFREIDPTKAFAYWSAFMKGVDDITITHQACHQIDSGSAVLVTEVTLAHTNVWEAHVKTADGQWGFVAERGIERQ
jgi:hypothetical protein